MDIINRAALLLAFTLLLPTWSALAQSQDQPQPQEQERDAAADAVRVQMQETITLLELTDEQRDPVETILRDSFQSRLAILEKYGINPQELEAGERPGRRTLRKMSREMNDLRDETRKQLEGVLTYEQMKTWNALEEARRDQMRERMRGR